MTNLEDEVVSIICPEYDQAAGICRLKKTALAGGPLSQLLERVSGDTLATRTTQCDLGPAPAGAGRGRVHVLPA